MPLPNKMDEEIAPAINIVPFNQQLLAHIRIKNSKSNANSAITPLTNHNVMPKITLLYLDVLITAAWTIYKGIVDVEENDRWE